MFSPAPRRRIWLVRDADGSDAVIHTPGMDETVTFRRLLET
jgi:hypothetical protein